MTSRVRKGELAHEDHRGFPRVAVYSHDTFGLGHLTRSTRIARGVVDAFPQGSVLLLSGSPIAHRFHFPPRVDYVKLPSVVKSGPDTYDARELGISRRRIRRMRAQLILDAIDLFRPHLLLVDNVPLGMKGELLPTLDWIRSQRLQTWIHLNLRDILDDPEVLRQNWQEHGVYGLLHETYDAIHVFGSRSVFDAVAAYELPDEKTDFLNYIPPAREELQSSSRMPAAEPGRSRILVTVGGGGDGLEVIHCVAALQQSLGDASPYQFHIVMGPLMDSEARRRIGDDLEGLPGISLHEYVPHLPVWMSRSDLILSMGGYNTLCEVMAVGQRSIVVPRTHPRREQEIRARALAARDILTVIHPDDLSVPTLDATLRRTLAAEPSLQSNGQPRLTGIQELQTRLRSLLGSHPRANPRNGQRPGRPATASPRRRRPRGRVRDSRGGTDSGTGFRAPRISTWLRDRGPGPGMLLWSLTLLVFRGLFG